MRAAHRTRRITEMKVFEGNAAYLAQQATCQFPVRLSYIREQMPRHIMLLTSTVTLTGIQRSGVLTQACYMSEKKGQMVFQVPQWRSGASYNPPTRLTRGAGSAGNTAARASSPDFSLLEGCEHVLVA